MKRIWVESERCMGCKTCEIACAVGRGSFSRTLMGAVKENPKSAANVTVVGDAKRSFPLQCRHCESARCLSACPSGAMSRDQETGVISVNAALCCGCWMCVMSCSFGVIRPSADYKVACKCDACVTMEEPSCVIACPTGALKYCGADEYAMLLAAKKRSVPALLDQCANAETR